MILDKLLTQTAMWDATANKWWIGETVEYRWTDPKNQPISDWMDLDNALQWIKEHDEQRHIRT